MNCASGNEDEAPTTSVSKQTKKCHIFYKNFSKDFWSSANFFLASIYIKIDDKRPTNIRYFMTKFWISGTSYANDQP